MNIYRKVLFSNGCLLSNTLKSTSLKYFFFIILTLATATASATSVPVDMRMREGTPARTPYSDKMYAPSITFSDDEPSRVGVT